MSFDRLFRRISELNNPTAAGLDPSFEKLPGFIREEALARCGKTPEAAAEAVLRFNRALIDALCDIVPAVKPQCACYEQYGWQGMRALSDTIRYAREKGMYVILDGKRNDIGSTMEAYARAYLGEVNIDGVKLQPFAADALTVNGYLGTDGVAPLLRACGKFDRAIFVLAKTSNPSSGELQNMELLKGGTVFERLGELIAKWSGSGPPGKYGWGCVGAVVGATYPEELGALRRQLPKVFFLVPGYGAQGGGASDVLPAFDEKGEGAVINASRSIIYAWKQEGCRDEDFAQAARREAIRMRDELCAALTAEGKGKVIYP